MKITLISPNYYPEDTAIGLYNSDLVGFLTENNCEVSIITAFPYYPQWRIRDEYKFKRRFLVENIANAKVIRYKHYVPKTPSFLKRIIHLIDFTIGSYFNLKKVQDSDVVISVVPFTSTLWLGNILKCRHRAKLWVHVQDFEFDAALQTGFLKKAKPLLALLLRLEKWLFSKADIASSISHSMLDKLAEKTSNERFYFPNWIDEKKINPELSNKHKFLTSSKIKILYSGNIGDKQDWNTFVRFCNDIDKEVYEVVIVGAGSKKDWLVGELSSLCNINYYPPVPFNELSDLLCSADVHVLFQKPEVIDTVMPSKVLGMMASAKPSIIIGNEASEVKSIFNASSAGFYFSEYSQKVVECLNILVKDKDSYIVKGISCRNYVIEHFSKEKILSKMLNKLKSL